MRFPYVFVVGFSLISGVFKNIPPCTIMAVPVPKIVEKNSAEADKENSKHSKKTADPANEKRESAQNSPAEIVKESPPSTVDYGKIIKEQLSDFLERDLPKSIAGLPLKPIATIAISNLPDGLKKAFLIGDKVYPGFSTLAQLFISGSIGGSDCPGVDPTAPCYVLLFPDKINGVAPLIGFKATPESLIVKNLQSEANRKGDWQLIAPSPIPEKTYGIWVAAPKDLLSDFKDFSIVTTLFDPAKECVHHLLSVDFDVESLSAFMPLPMLKLAYDAYIKDDFDKITLTLDTEGDELRVSLRHRAKPKTPWSIYGKSLSERMRDHHILDFPSKGTMLKVFSFCDYTALETLFSALSTRIKPSEWECDPIAHQVYRWAQIIYPVVTECLRFGREFSTGNSQRYDILGDGKSKSVSFSFEEMKPSMTDNRLCSFLEDLSKICRQQFSSAACKNLPGSEIFDGGCCFDKGSLVHKLIFGSNDAKHPGTLRLYCSLGRGYLFWATSLEGFKKSIERMKDVRTFSYIQNQKQNYDVCLQLDIFNDFGIEFSKDAVVGISSEVEVDPEVFVTTIRVSLSAIETVCGLFFESASSEEPDARDTSEVGQKTEKTTEDDATDTSVQSPDVSTTDKPKDDKNASDPAIPAQSAAVR